MAEKCTRQLPPIRVPESLELALMRLAAQLAGVDLEIAMHQGDREEAQRCLQEMNQQTALRKAARQDQEV